MSERALARNALSRPYVSIGSEKGTLAAAEDGGVWRFVLRERPGDPGIRCDVRPELFERAVAANGCSVWLTGECRYSGESAIPDSIKVEEIEVLPDDDELPKFSDWMGTMPDITGGLTTDEFLAEGRDG